ncbi:hypothetical protein PPNSA23_40340 [Phyllobacterium phragmitis]|uniref:Uncharacterized protein n=1 Tax=Phyllobacterium phragmitis TaxID=2670329 RepID=A0ABQ0H585_9HYPH
MDIAPESVIQPQDFCYSHQIGRGFVGRPNYPGGEEKAFNAIAAVKVKCEPDHFIDAETRTPHVA